MKRILTSFALVAASVAFSQVSIAPSEVTPKATLDVEAIGGSTADGILIPRVDRARAEAMVNVEKSTLIYVNSVANGAQAGQAIEVDTEGFYYFDGTKWVKFGASSKAPVVQDYDTATATVEDDADFVIFTPTSGASTLTLPPSNSTNGRQVCIFNNSNDDNVTVTPTPRGQNSSIYTNSGACFVSFDNVWYGVGFF